MAESSIPQVPSGHYYRRAPTARGEARRQAILEASIDLFRERGFHNTTMDDIGAAAGVTGPALYHHFDNKQEILASVFFRIGDEIFDAMNETVQSDIASTELLDALVSQYVDIVLRNRRGFPLLYIELRNLAPADAEPTRERRRLFYEHWGRAVSLMRPDLLPSEAQQIAMSVAWVVQGMAFVDPVIPDAQLRPLLRNIVLSSVREVPGGAQRRH